MQIRKPFHRLGRQESRGNQSKTVIHVDELGKKKANEILFSTLGSEYSIDWSLPQSVGQKGDSRFVGDTLTIVPESRNAFEIIYGGAHYSRYGSNYPLGELSSRLTNEINGLGRVLIEIARRDD